MSDTFTFDTNVSLDDLIKDEEIKYYNTESEYTDPQLQKIFTRLKFNMVDINPGRVAKIIRGTKQDYNNFMSQAKDFLNASYPTLSEDIKKKLYTMLANCVYGYYILTPLVNNNEVSDIKVLNWNHIVVKVKGKRYVSNLSFPNEEDYLSFYDRVLIQQNLYKDEENGLQHATDRFNIEKFYLRIDTQHKIITSTSAPNLHIRKIPKEKYSWNYLIENGMLTEDILKYLLDRVRGGYGFLISGRGGSGKSTLLNNLLDKIPYDESALVVQESDELYSNHPNMQFEHTVEIHREDHIVTYSLEDELRLGLLQDIDNFIIGEIKGGEALHVFTTAMSTGARFMGTIHSNDAKGSVARLAHCARYVSDYSVETLEEMLTSAPFVLVHMSNFSIDEILEIKGWDSSLNQLIFEKICELPTT